MQTGNLIIWAIFLIWSLLLTPSTSKGGGNGIHEAGLTCASYSYPGEGGNKLMMQQSMMALMDAVSSQVKERGWGAQTLYGWHRPMHALGQCNRNLNRTQCYACFTQARHMLSRCVPNVAGRVYIDGCFLRYDNYTFFAESVDPTRDTNVCDRSQQGNNGEFSKRVASVVLNVSTTAGEQGFAVDGDGGVFALAQCWETLDKPSCQRCLREAGERVQGCVPGAEGRSLFTGCFLRYSTHKFYDGVVLQNEIEGPPAGLERPSVWIIVACGSAIVVILLIVLGALLMIRKRKASHGKRSNDFGASPGFANVAAGFNFRYDVLEKATNYFDSANKLGQERQGGVGSVFKGTLPSGRTVAVKRLFFDTRQWTDGLFNEVNLINGIQHKNVVKLLGCSINEGPESLLVYEFVPNKSLDQILFGKDSENVLNWEQRFQIICGIAEGLAYLHGGSGTKIIHKDIKPSNILIDENLNPKIVDFGFAHCVVDKFHLRTGIAGSTGYIAPEYASQGKLTEKADVYAFGVMLVEIVCGKKNSVYTQGSTSLLHCVWKNYKANDITTSVDPSLCGKFVVEEATNALQAGLLCTQSSITLRPSMSEVVQMLIKKDCVIPSSKQQPFHNHGVLSLHDRILGSTMRHASVRSSFHSTTSSLTPNEDFTLLVQQNSFSSSTKSNTTESHDSNIQANIGAPEPR